MMGIMRNLIIISLLAMAACGDNLGGYGYPPDEPRPDGRGFHFPGDHLPDGVITVEPDASVLTQETPDASCDEDLKAACCHALTTGA